MKALSVLVIASLTVALTAGGGMRDRRSRQKPLRHRFVGCKKEVPYRRSQPDRMHRQRLPSNSSRLPSANRLQLGWYPLRFRCRCLSASQRATWLKSHVNVRRIRG